MRIFLCRLKSLFPRYRRARDQDIQEELAALEQFASRKELGNLTAAAKQARAAVGFPLIQGAGADIQYAWRSLKRDRAFMLVALVSLAIGIGANIAVFGLMDALLWRQLPIRDPEQLVSFENTSRSYFGYSEFSKHAGNALQQVVAQSSVFEVPVDLGGGPARRQVEFVSGNYFKALGVAPEIGRSILPFDDELQHSAQVAMLSFSYWRRAFNQNPTAVGRYVHVGKALFLIIGVAPQDFFGLSVGEAPDLWLPLTTSPAVLVEGGWLTGRNNNWLNIFGRLRRGISISQVQGILTPISVDIDIQRDRLVPSQMERETMLKDSIRLIPASKGISELRERFSKPLHVVFGMLGIGLLLACINVVSLQFARSDQSRKEFAIRLAIGAGRFRVARQCLIETLMLSIASACLALFLFKPMTNSVLSLMSVWGSVPAKLDLKLDGDTLAFVLSTCLGVALISGLLPAIYATRQQLQLGLQAGSPSIVGRHGRTTIIRAVGIVQIAVSLVMISLTCLFALSLERLQRFDSGVKRDRLVEIELDPAAAGYSGQRTALLDENLRNRFRLISGVEHVTYSQDGIYSGRNSSSTFEVDGADVSDQKDKYGIYDYVGPNFFTTLGTTVLAGRDFKDRDNSSSPGVVVINQTFAERFFPARSAIGRNMYVSDQKARKAYQIIGVVRDVRSDLRRTRLAWYFAAQQHQTHPFSSRFLMRTKTENATLLTRIKAVMHAENPKLRIDNVQSANELFEGTLETDRLLARLGWAFGVLALLLASAGIYGLLSYDVTRRTSEIGIRTALGAYRSDIAKLILSQAAFIVVFGLVFGAAAANIMTRSLRSLVFGLEASDPRIEVAAAVMLTAVALAAAWIPIERATRIQPMRALRTE